MVSGLVEGPGWKLGAGNRCGFKSRAIRWLISQAEILGLLMCCKVVQHGDRLPAGKQCESAGSTLERLGIGEPTSLLMRQSIVAWEFDSPPFRAVVAQW